MYFYNRNTNKLKENNLGDIFGVQCLYGSEFDKNNCHYIKSDDKMGVINRDGEFVIGPKYDYIGDLEGNNERSVELGGKWSKITLQQDGTYSEPVWE